MHVTSAGVMMQRLHYFSGLNPSVGSDETIDLALIAIGCIDGVAGPEYG